MKYINPRLKHVKSIQLTIQTLLWDIQRKNFDEEVAKQYIKDILDQCNLLLETKKAKKRKKCTCNAYEIDGKKWVSPCKIHPLPDPKEEKGEIERLDLWQIVKEAQTLGYFQDNTIPNALEEKLNELVDRVNILSKSK